MRHRARSRKLGRTSAHRKAMYRNMVTSLLEHERIQTTDAKAKEVRRIAERMITLGKRGGLHARRRALRVIRRREVAAKVFDELAERYRERPGGYTRVLKLRVRRGDAAPISLVELVEAGASPAPEKKTGKKAASKKASSAKAAKAASEGKAESKKTAAKKTTRKTTATKKTSSKKTSAKKSSAKKTSAKKSTSKKTARKKTTGK
jgi:large subunit ribosomal protein L17